MEGLVGEETISCNLFIIGANLRHIIVFFVTSFVASPRKGSFALKIYIFFYREVQSTNNPKQRKKMERKRTSTNKSFSTDNNINTECLAVATSWCCGSPHRSTFVASCRALQSKLRCRRFGETTRG